MDQKVVILWEMVSIGNYRVSSPAQIWGPMPGNIVEKYIHDKSVQLGHSLSEFTSHSILDA